MKTVGKIMAMATLGVAAMAVADPVCDTADLIHRWSFNGNLEDSVGGLTATAAGNTAYNDESNPTAISLNGNGHDTAYLNLGTGIVPAEGGPITIEIWATQYSEKNWSRIFDFGPDNQNYLLMSWTQGTGLTTDAVEIKTGNTTILRADNQLQPYELYVPYHISLTLVQNGDGKVAMSWAKRDAATGAVLKSGSGTTSAAWNISEIANWTYCCIGRSQYTGDSDAKASYDEVRIWKTALTAEQLTWSAKLGPDVLPTSEVSANSTMTLACDNGSVSVNGAAAVGGGNVSVPRSPDAVLTAVPLAGYTFVRWSGDTDRILSGNVNTAEITVNSAQDFALVAEFESADNVVYARYENGSFVYLTPSKAVGNAPQGGMNEGITILFSSDAEYQQLRTIPDEVAKAKGLELGGNVKLTDAADWTAMDYSFACYSVDLNGKTLVTRSMDSGNDLVMKNNDFEADVIADGAFVAMTPQDWVASGAVRLLKNERDHGDTQYGKSTWCYLPGGTYIEKQFNVLESGGFVVKFNAASHNNVSSYSGSNGYAQLDGVTQWSESSVGYGGGEKSFTVTLGAGVHTLRIGCSGGAGVLYDNVSIVRKNSPLIENGDFESDPIDSNTQVAMTPKGWNMGTGAYLIKDNTSVGYSNRNGSNWLYVDNGGYVQQQFTLEKGGYCTLSFKVASRDDAGSWKNSSCYMQIDGNNVHNEYTGTWNSRDKSYTVYVNAGSHTLKVGCNGGGSVLVDNVSLVLGGYGSEVTSSTEGEAVVNGGFQADSIADGAQVAMTPQSWTSGGNVYLLKNHTGNGYSNRDGSNWLYLTNGGYVQQQFTVGIEGDCTLSFKVASRDSSGSWNNSSCYMQIDGNNVHNGYTGSWNSSSKSYTVHLNAGSHTLKIGCNGGTAVLVDNVSLKCPFGLVVDVPEGNTLVNDMVHIGGTNLKLVKSGAGTLVANRSGQTYTGGTRVTEGQLTIGNNTALGAASEVIVDPDGILELNGKSDLQAYRFVLNGGVLQNTEADVGEGYAQITSLRLTADSTFKPSCSYGLIGSGYAATTLDLAGHTLTVPIGTGKKFYLFNTTVTAGTLDISGDGWLVADKTAVNASAADLLVNSALDIRVPFSVGSYEALYTGNNNAGDKTLAVQRTFKPHSSYYHGVTLANNATIDLTACPDTVNTPSLFTSGANEIILQAAEVVTPLQSIESSGTQWIDTGYVCTANTRIEASLNTCTRTTAWGVLFGVTGGDRSSDGVLLRYMNDTTALNGWFCNATYEEAQVENLQGQDVEVVLEANKLTLNGVEKTITTSATPYASPLYLFCGNNAGSAWRHQSMRLYSMKISEGGVLKRDFVPGRNREGVVGLWDRVESKFYVNKGSGTFAAVEISGETPPEPFVLPTNLSIELHGRQLGISKIIGWNAIPANVIFTPTEATRNDHVIFDVRANGLYVPRNTVIYFR